MQENKRMIDRLNKAGDGVDVAASLQKAHSYSTIQSGWISAIDKPWQYEHFPFCLSHIFARLAPFTTEVHILSTENWWLNTDIGSLLYDTILSHILRPFSRTISLRYFPLCSSSTLYKITSNRIQCLLLRPSIRAVYQVNCGLLDFNIPKNSGGSSGILSD